jgi:conjugative relaxase-like TrwC/TraI family protein
MTIISKPLSGRQAKDYYQEDYSNVENNCYTYHDEVIGEWFGRLAAEMGLDGKLAAEMGLAGDVEWEQYERLVDGENPHTGERLIERIQPDAYTNHSGNHVMTTEGSAALEAIFSAPASASIAALLGGDERIRRAHWNAVNTTLVALEEHTYTEVEGVSSPVRAGKMIAAVFEHDVAPAANKPGHVVPHLHTHTIIFNLTRLGGEWRELDWRELLRSREYATAIYHAVLGAELRRLGYELDALEETGAPEIKGFTKDPEACAVRVEEARVEFDAEARGARRVFKAIEAHTRDCGRTLPLIELRRGDIIEVGVAGGRGIITEIDDSGISILGVYGQRLGLELEEQFIIKRSPDQIEDWIFLSLQQDQPIHFYLMTKSCWKCGFAGWAAALRVEGYLIADARSLFHYPGVRMQLREFFDMRPDLKAGFGAVKERFSKTTGETNLSQGCARCDALWGVFHLTEDFRSYVVDLPYSAESGRIIPVFEVKIGRLFDEGEAPQTGV